MSEHNIVFLFDKVGESEVGPNGLKADSQTVKLYRYLDNHVKTLLKGDKVRTTVMIAAPRPGKVNAKEYRLHAENVQKSMADFGTTLVVNLGKSAIYAVEDKLPSDFPKSLKYQRLWGRYFSLYPFGAGTSNGGPTCVFCPSSSMVFAGKSQEGGYLHLRTVVENVTGALLQTTDRIETVSEFVSERERLDSLKGNWLHPRNKLLNISTDATVGVDTETTGLNVITDKIRTVQLTIKGGESFVFPYDIQSAAEWTDLFNGLRQAGYKLVLQNGKYDSKILKSNGVHLGDYHELSVAHVLLDEREGTHNLDFIGQQVLGAGKTTITTGQLVNGPIDQTFITYAGRDTDITKRAFDQLYPAVKSRKAYQILTKSAVLMAEGEHFGIRLDVDKLDTLIYTARSKRAEYKQLFSELGLNPQSPLQVKKYFGLSAKSDKNALELLDDEVARAIIDYRGLTKLYSSYLARLKASADVDGRFHPDIRLAGPVTGRTSSGSGSAPRDALWLPINSQNIPRPAMGQQFKYVSEQLRSELRSLFIADEGRVMLGMDLAAAEMRMAANACMDPVMIEDLNRKVDTHSLLTVMAYNLPYELDLENPDSWVKEVKKNYEFERTATKAATFATLYGGGLSAIAQQAKCDLPTAKLLKEAIYSRYTGLEHWVNEIHNRVRTTGRISTRYGRERIFPYSTGVFDNQQQQGMLREAQNYVIQSEANDYCLLGITKFLENLPSHFEPVYWQNFVHDAGYFSVTEDNADEAKKLLIEAMESADDVPSIMYADAKYGQNWGAL